MVVNAWSDTYTPGIGKVIACADIETRQLAVIGAVISGYRISRPQGSLGRSGDSEQQHRNSHDCSDDIPHNRRKNNHSSSNIKIAAKKTGPALADPDISITFNRLENERYTCVELVPGKRAAEGFIDLVETIVVANFEADHVVELESEATADHNIQVLIIIDIIHIA